jgi:hypothetical protein
MLALATGCGGGAGDTPAAAPDPTAGVEDETTSVATQPQSAAPKSVPKIDESTIPAAGTPISRESYTYAGGSRDPFASVMDGGSTGPELADLDLTSIYLLNPSRSSVAVLRDRLNGKIYSVREGERLGRMRIADIRKLDVTFNIDDYGTTRQVTLTLRKQEGSSP